MDKLLEIQNVLQILITCWILAEESLQDDIFYCYPDVNEEFITQMFHGKYAAILSYASQCKHIENAFLKDLQKSFPSLSQYLHQVANGLIAEIILHKKKTETITGGDIGLLIIRPHVYKDAYYLRIKDYRRGLLCQAKLRNYKGKWGNFTKRQAEVLPDKLSYLSLLLYSYRDTQRRFLNKFSWQLCNATILNEVQQWLNKNDFPNLISSDAVIAKLGCGDIGTDNDDIIDSIISPSKNPTLEIRVTWPENNRPGGPESKVRIYSQYENKIHQRIRIRG